MNDTENDGEGSKHHKRKFYKVMVAHVLKEHSISKKVKLLGIASVLTLRMIFSQNYSVIKPLEQLTSFLNAFFLPRKILSHRKKIIKCRISNFGSGSNVLKWKAHRVHHVSLSRGMIEQDTFCKRVRKMFHNCRLFILNPATHFSKAFEASKART